MGQYLYAAGTSSVRGGRLLRRWLRGGRGGSEDISVSSNTVMDLAPLPDGGLVFGARLLGVVSSPGSVVRRQEPAIADFRDNQDGFRVSAHGIIGTP